MVTVLGPPGASLLVPLGKGNEGSGIRLTSPLLMLDAMSVLRTCESQLLTKSSFVSGKRLYIGNDRSWWSTYDGRAAIVSSLITKQSQLCSVVFFYRVFRKGSARLSLYIQTG